MLRQLASSLRLPRSPLAMVCRGVLMASLVLPSMVSTSQAQSLPPIQLKKTWPSTLEPIKLKRPNTGLGTDTLPSGLPAWDPIPPAALRQYEETPRPLEALDTPPALSMSLPAEEPLAPNETLAEEVDSAPVEDLSALRDAGADAPLNEVAEREEATPPAAAPEVEVIVPARRTAPIKDMPQALESQVVLPQMLLRVPVPTDMTQLDDRVINQLIAVADQYPNVPQLLLEVRGLAPMSATSRERQEAYLRAQLIMSGLVSAGIPYYQIGAFVTLAEISGTPLVEVIRIR